MLAAAIKNRSYINWPRAIGELLAENGFNNEFSIGPEVKHDKIDNQGNLIVCLGKSSVSFIDPSQDLINWLQIECLRLNRPTSLSCQYIIICEPGRYFTDARRVGLRTDGVRLNLLNYCLLEGFHRSIMESGIHYVLAANYCYGDFPNCQIAIRCDPMAGMEYNDDRCYQTRPGLALDLINLESSIEQLINFQRRAMGVKSA